MDSHELAKTEFSVENEQNSNLSHSYIPLSLLQGILQLSNLLKNQTILNVLYKPKIDPFYKAIVVAQLVKHLPVKFLARVRFPVPAPALFRVSHGGQFLEASDLVRIGESRSLGIKIRQYSPAKAGIHA